ncbi:MAG: hypothetical protein KA207_03090 [Burkholderiaceae bacterium]|nr:hypothetical protein [Betaproteobacteria bacterium]MBP6644812.1 hypothetical protein [Burkholderiaceae bacterium]
MRFRLLRRRLTVSAPRMAVRSALPWPFRWILISVVLGFSAAIALWAFEFGKDIAGLDRNDKMELVKLREENAKLQVERDKAQSIANTADSQLVTEKAVQEALNAQVKKLEAENQGLKDDLGFFQTLMPLANATDTLAVRGLQAEVLGNSQLKWQVLLVQASKNAPEFNGKLEISLAGTENGRPWTMMLPTGLLAVQFRQYRRLEGLIALPLQTVVKTVTVRVLDGNATRASQSIKL